jgi:hypothetical protein
MGAIMAELSKTAKASMVREVKKAKVETPEESLRQLRLDLAAGLYVPSHRIKVLLDLYDAAISAQQAAQESAKPAILGAPYDLSEPGIPVEEGYAKLAMKVD